MSRHRTTSRLPSRKAWALAAPAFGALGATFLAVMVPADAMADDRNCADFASRTEAQAFFVGAGGSAAVNVDNLDADHDGQVCENFTYATAGTSSSAGTSADANLDRADVPQGGVAAGDGDASGLFRLF